MTAAFKDASRPYQAAEIQADFVVHLAGTLSGILAAAALVAVASVSAAPIVVCSVASYGMGLVAMLGCSAAYHLRRSSAQRELLRRLDHAAIFVMIAGTYTPFTACVLSDDRAVWLTIAMWLAALAGVIMKLAYPRRFEWASLAIYLTLGWSFVIFMRPLFGLLDRSTMLLLVSGGVVYSVGAGIHRWDRLPFHDAIWHALVVVAAGLHYAAILHAIVLTGARG